MNMRKDIKNAFGSVHAPDDLVERLKQELYQKDCHEELEEICEATEAPKPQIWRYITYIAAALALCVGCGLSVWSLRDNPSPLNPQTSVPVVTTTEDTTESGTDMEAAERAAYEQMQREKEQRKTEESIRSAESAAYEEIDHEHAMYEQMQLEMEYKKAEESRLAEERNTETK